VIIAMRRELQALTAPADGAAGPTRAKKVRIWDEEDV
jgi:hypothetical protein